MKKTIYLLIACLVFSNCTHHIVRTGYDISKADYKRCDAIIKKNFQVPDTLANKIGEIKLGETGFAVACSEGHAINILKGEACAIDADLIIITKENRPDLWSSCYRCTATFYRYSSSSPSLIAPDNDYNTNNVKNRVSGDRSRNTAIAIGSLAVGFMFGFLLFL